MQKYSIAIAGSTQHTRMCAEVLLQDERFTIPWILTPGPKPLGRKKVMTPNPLHAFADQHQIPLIFLDKKIDDEVQRCVSSQDRPDFLLVVDFGYLVPKWLLEFPTLAPLNIHPSDLPRWRGSSPGQFVLLYGEKTSAVTLMIMNEGLDTGAVVHKEFFDVQKTWTQTEYYHHSFALIGQVLADKIVGLAEGQITPENQPEESPTPLARRFTKEDGFVSWQTILHSAKNGGGVSSQDSLLLNEKMLNSPTNLSFLLDCAVRALSPWPGLWTVAPTPSGEKRLKILSGSIDPRTGSFSPETVQLEGELPSTWAEIQTKIVTK